MANNSLFYNNEIFPGDETHFMIFIIDSVTALFELLNVSHKELECCYGN